MGVGSAISKMFTRQFKVPTPGVKSADGSDAKAMREVEAGASGKVDAGKEGSFFRPPPKEIDKRIVELEKDDRAGELGKQDKKDLEKLKEYRDKTDAEQAERQQGRTPKGRQNQSDAQKKAAAKRKEDKDGDGFDQSTGEITNKKKFMALTQKRRDALQRSALIQRAIKKKDATSKVALQGSKAEKNSPTKLSKTPSTLSRGGSLGQANSRFGSKDFRNGGMFYTTNKKK